MATLIWISIIIISLFITICLYACIVVGKQSKSDKEILDEEQEEIQYIKKCQEAKKLRKIDNKRKYKDKKEKDIIYL